MNAPNETDKVPTACGPECDCGTPPGKGRAKMVIGGVVLLAIAGILAYKIYVGRQTSTATCVPQNPAEYAVAQMTENTTPEDKSDARGALEQKKSEGNVQSKKIAASNGGGAARPARGGAMIGAYLDSLSELNKVALAQDAVFILIPSGKNENVNDSTRTAVVSAQKTLDSRNVKVGLFTLKISSADYKAVSSKTTLPAIIVACKGRGMGTVSGAVTETKLLQTYTASSQPSGCCPSGSGSSVCK